MKKEHRYLLQSIFIDYIKTYLCNVFNQPTCLQVSNQANLNMNTTRSSSGSITDPTDNNETNDSVMQTMLSLHAKHIYMKKESKQLDNICLAAFKNHKSTCAIVMGPPESGKDDFIHSYFLNFKNNEHLTDSAKSNTSNNNDAFSHTNCKIAIIDGEVLENDSQAIISLAEQLMGKGLSKNFALNSEAIHDCFKTSYLEKQPIIIIIRNIEKFACSNSANNIYSKQTKRQVFLYMLLDLMQRKDLLFVVIGLTSYNIQSLLEKRILSRLNACFIYMPRYTVTSCCKDMSHNLLIPQGKQCRVQLMDEMLRDARIQMEMELDVDTLETPLTSGVDKGVGSLEQESALDPEACNRKRPRVEGNTFVDSNKNAIVSASVESKSEVMNGNASLGLRREDCIEQLQQWIEAYNDEIIRCFIDKNWGVPCAFPTTGTVPEQDPNSVLKQSEGQCTDVEHSDMDRWVAHIDNCEAAGGSLVPFLRCTIDYGLEHM